MEQENHDERWLWMSFAPVHRLIIALLPGPRTQEMADAVVEETDGRIAQPLPLFVSDGLKWYSQALLKLYHYTREFSRKGPENREDHASQYNCHCQSCDMPKS